LAPLLDGTEAPTNEDKSFSCHQYYAQNQMNLEKGFGEDIF